MRPSGITDGIFEPFDAVPLAFPRFNEAVGYYRRNRRTRTGYRRVNTLLASMRPSGITDGIEEHVVPAEEEPAPEWASMRPSGITDGIPDRMTGSFGFSVPTLQ